VIKKLGKIMRVKIGLKCEESGDINYTTTKNSKTMTEKLELMKYSPRLKKRTLHKEVKLKS
jgi:large subunit ribosomal protein L33